MGLFCGLNELVHIKYLESYLAERSHSTRVSGCYYFTGVTLGKRKARGKWAPSWSGLSYLRDGNDKWLSLQRSSIWGQFQVFQKQSVAGDHVIPENLGHHALFVPVLNLWRKIRGSQPEPGGFCSDFSFVVLSSIHPLPTLPTGTLGSRQSGWLVVRVTGYRLCRQEGQSGPSSFPASLEEAQSTRELGWSSSGPASHNTCAKDPKSYGKRWETLPRTSLLGEVPSLERSCCFSIYKSKDKPY